MNNTKINSAPRKRSYSRHLFPLCLFITSVVLGHITEVSAQADNGRAKAIEHLRTVLEQPFLEHGGFDKFDCSLTTGAQPTKPFTCSAAALGDKQFEYLLVPDPDVGVKVEMVTEPASQLDYDWLPALDNTCRQFLKNLNQANWSAIYAEFDPNLQKIVSQAELESSMSSVLDLLGLLGDPQLESYTSRGSGGRDELHYKVPAKNSQAAFRCGLNANGNTVTILAYLITPDPGSPLYKTTLEKDVAVQLSKTLGKPVSQVEIPFEQLPNTYDIADGIGVLEDGSRFKIRVIRSGRLDDFSPKDYTFQVLESEAYED